jgi:molybdate transport system ATP-binding protein
MRRVADSAASPYLGVALSHIDLVRGGRRVLAGLNWRIRAGERWVLLGANGAGKSQLLKLIAGDVWPQPTLRARRRYCLRGEWHGQPQAVREAIAYLGSERHDRYQHYDWNHRALTIVGTGLQRGDIPMGPLTRAQRIRCRALLARVGIEQLAARRFLALSYGEQRLVLLARALAWRPKLLLLDEPLNGLDPRNRTRMLRVLGSLARSHLPWIYATHRLEEVPFGATHLARLEGGRIRRARWSAKRPLPAAPGAGASRARVVGSVVRDAARAPAAQAGAQAPHSPVLLRLHRAAVWRAGTRALQALDWELRAGECWVVHGANGSGKSTFLGALFGEHALIAAAQVWRAGHAPGQPLDAFQRRVGRVSPELQAALPRAATALATVVAGWRNAHALATPATRAEQLRARAALRLCGAAALASRAYGTLSYGQARRVLFARALVLEPDILLLDEPCTGLDGRTRASLLALLDSARLRTMTLIMASHHRDEWPARASHELELRAGRVRYAGPLRGRAP